MRTVGRSRGQAAAEVAEPLLLDVCVRAALLPRSDREVRQHARRRQSDVRGLLPDGSVARPHLQGDARGAVPRQRVAEVPARERGTRVQAHVSSAYEDAKAGGVVDTAVGFPKSRDDMFEFYEFIRK